MKDTPSIGRANNVFLRAWRRILESTAVNDRTFAAILPRRRVREAAQNTGLAAW